MPLQKFDKGYVLKADDLNMVVDEINRLNKIRTGGGIGLSNTSAGIKLWLEGQDDVKVGVTADSGSCGSLSSENFQDQRYWVKRCYLANTNSDACDKANTWTAYGSSSPYYEQVPVTNLGEAYEGSHRLPAGTLVLYWSQYDTGNPPTERHFMFTAAPAGVLVTITGHAGSGDYASGNGGKYAGTYSRGTTKDAFHPGITPTGDFSGAPHSLFVNGTASATACLICNVAETSSNWIPANTQTIGLIVGWTDEATPKPVVWVSLPPPNGLVACKVTDDGTGSNGDGTTAANYKYNVKDLSGAAIGAGLAVGRPRPVGAVTQQGADGIGLGYWTGGTFNLWDAGEIPQIGSCPINDTDG